VPTREKTTAPVVTLTGTEPRKAAKPDRRSNPGAGRSCQTMMHR